MKLTDIERGQRAPSDAFDEISSKPTTLRHKCIAAGMTPWSGSQWRRRHPDSTLSDDEVVALMLANKRNQAEREARNAQRPKKPARKSGADFDRYLIVQQAMGAL